MVVADGGRGDALQPGRGAGDPLPLPGSEYPLAVDQSEWQDRQVTPRVEVVESRMRGNTHVRFGGRTGETERPRGRHRALVRPYYVKAHEGASVVSKAIVVATGVARTGDREVLRLAVGDSEYGAFWTAFLRSLLAKEVEGAKTVLLAS